MFKLFLSIAFFISIGIGYSQSFSVDQILIQIDGDASNESIASNTFLHAISSDDLQWTIVDASIPQEWEFSNCFPNCYNIGVTSGNLTIIEGQSYYLNCHVYPNNTPGEGSITMQITSGNGTSELVTWQAIAGSSSLIENQLNQKQVKAIYTLDGKKVDELIKNTVMVVLFENGSTQQVFVTE